MPSDRLYGLPTTPAGFGARFDGNIVLPIVDGKIATSHPALGTVDGVVTSSKCVSYDAKSMVQHVYIGPSSLVETHLEERNAF